MLTQLHHIKLLRMTFSNISCCFKKKCKTPLCMSTDPFRSLVLVQRTVCQSMSFLHLWWASSLALRWSFIMSSTQP